MQNVSVYGGCGNSCSLKSKRFKWCIVLYLVVCGCTRALDFRFKKNNNINLDGKPKP